MNNELRKMLSRTTLFPRVSETTNLLLHYWDLNITISVVTGQQHSQSPVATSLLPGDSGLEVSESVIFREQRLMMLSIVNQRKLVVFIKKK